MVWVGGLGLRKILPIMGVLNDVNRMLSNTPLQECSYGITVWAIQICKIKLQNKKEAILNVLLSGHKSSGGVYANINAVHDLRLNYSSVRLHCVST